MSASSGPLASTKGDSTSSKSSKPAYDHLDINKLYKGKSTEPVSKPVAQKHGMQILGKAIPARRPGQLSSVKAESSSNDTNNSSATTPSSSVGPPTSTSTALAPSNQSQGNLPPPGWSSTHPLPPGPPSPSPRSVPSAPVTGQHMHDKNWNSGSDPSGPYQSQRFAQDFPSLASGADAPKGPPAGGSGASPGVQGSQSMSKPQDNQYGPGPILRPQTEGSWTQGGGRGVPRPPGPVPPLNAPSREFQGPDRASLGGPTPPPMSLGQGGPAPPPLGAFPMPPYRGMVPAQFMYPNGPPAPGPGFYPGGGNMSRFAMAIPPRAPPPSGGGPDGPPPRELNRNRAPPPSSQRQAVFATVPIIKDEDLKRMDKLGGPDGGWASTQDDIDYNKTLSFSDDEDGKENSGKKPAVSNKVAINDSRADQKGDRDRDRDREEPTSVIERRPTKILDRQSSRELEREGRDRERDRDLRERDPRDPRFDNAPSKDALSRGVSYGYEGDEDWKAQQLPMPPPQQQQRRVNLAYEDKGGDRRDRDRDRERDRDRDRDIRDRRGDDRGPRRPMDRRDDTIDNWRSAPSRQFDDDMRKPPLSRGGRDDVRSDFPPKSHPSNLPPRLQRQQFQGGGGGGPPPIIQNQQPQPSQRQTPSPGSSGGKDREFPSGGGGRDWDRDKGIPDRRRMDMDNNRKRDDRRDRYYNDYDSRNDRMMDKDSKGSRYGADFQRERSKESEESRTMGSSAGSGAAPARSGSTAAAAEQPRQSPPEVKESTKKEETKSSGPPMSWADEVDDEEISRAREQERKMETGPKPVQPTKRVYIAPSQRKVSDMQSQKAEPTPEVKQSSSSSSEQPAKTEQSDQAEKPKPVWGEKDSWDKANNAKGDKETSPPVKDKNYPSSGGDTDSSSSRRSQERDIQPSKRPTSQQQGPPHSGGGSSGAPKQHSNSSEPQASTNGHPESSGKAHPVTKSSSNRSIAGEGDLGSSIDNHQEPLQQRSNSISDASDRDHGDREGSKPSYNRQVSQEKGSGGAAGGFDGKQQKQQKASEREKRVKRDSDRDGSDVGSEHGGSRGSEKSQRGGSRIRDRGTYPVYRARERGQWDRNSRARGARGRGNSGGRDGHYYDKPPKHGDSEHEHHHKRDEFPSDASEGAKPEGPSEEHSKEIIENQPLKKDIQSSEENIPRAKKEKDLENSAKKSGKSSGNKRNSNNNARGGSKLEGYGPPSDQKPFSTSSNKDDDSAEKKEKGGEAGLPSAKEGGIPSLMAVDISPPSLPQLKKGHRGDRERDFHPAGRPVPPRMQQLPQQRNDSYPERGERHQRGGKRGKDLPQTIPSSSSKKEGEDSEEWTDNDSDAESRKSGSAGSKSKRENHQEGKKGGKKHQQEKGFGSSSSTATAGAKPASRNANGGGSSGGEKGSKPIRVKNPPYEARSSAHSNLPPRLAAAKQRDSQVGPPQAGNGKPGDASNVTKGVEPAAPPQVNAWEKPITPTLRSDTHPGSASPPGAAPPSAAAALVTSKDSNDLSLSGVTSQISGAPSSTVVSAVLDGTNPPTRTLIFESRNYKSGGGGGVTSDGVKASAASKLPEAKKDSVPSSTGIEFGKNLGGLSFSSKGAGEDSPELDFGSSPLDEPLSIPQSQASASMMTTHNTSSPKPSNLLPQASRHSSFDHQPSPTSRGDVELKQKIQSVKIMWENPSMPGVPEQLGVCGSEDNAFHGAFATDSYKGSDAGSRDFGPPSLSQSAVGYSTGGSSPSISSMTNPEASSSPNSNMRPTSKTPQQQQQPPASVTKSQGHGPGPIASPFGNYGMENAQHMGAKGFGGIQVVPQPNYMFAPKVLPLDPFAPQLTQFPNAPQGGCGPSPYGQGGSVLIRPMEPKYQPMFPQHGGSQNRQGGQGTNHNRVSPGPITSSSGGNSAGGGHINSRSNTMMSKNQQQTNRNAAHACMTQPVHPQAQQNFYHTHNPMSQQQVPKGPFGPANGGYSEGGMTPTYQPPIIIPVDVNPAMFTLGGNYESSDIRSGPPPSGPAPPGTPPVQGSSSYYFGSNNNPACVFPPNSSTNFGLPFAASLKMPTYNSTGAAGSDSGSNLSSQRIRPNEQQFMQPGMDPLPQNAMKSSHDYLINQPPRWNSGGNEFAVNPGIHWTPGPIQRPIFNTPTAGPVGMSLVHSSPHYMPSNIGAPPGCVGVKPNNSSNDSMTNPGTPPKSPHPRKNV